MTVASVASVGGLRRVRPLSVVRRNIAIILDGASGRIGLALLLIILLVVLIGPHVAPYSSTEIGLGPPGSGPSADHWLGTDALGRDVFSRLLHGGGTIVLLPTLSVLLAFAVALPIGLWSGYRGGYRDLLVMRIVDVLLCLPPLLVILAMLVVFGGSNVVLVVVVGGSFMPRIIRIVRGAMLSVVSEDYVVAAKARGESTMGILMREILPNVTGPLLAEFAIRLNYAIIFIATLSFLGLGVQPPFPDWGLMVGEGRVLLSQAPLVALAPAIAIATLAIGVNLISDQIASHLSRNVEVALMSTAH